MKIGELLVEQRKLRSSDLTRALAEKPAERRFASFLIARGLVEFDDASRALGEQLKVSCALAKHLAGRDPALAKLIPAELGRGSCALPIGKTSKGAVIVCVRDPAAALLATLEQAIKASVLMIVAPSMRLEHLVAETYGRGDDFELDIDFDSSLHPNPLTEPPVETPRRSMTTPPAPYERVQPPPSTPPMPDMSALDPESVRLSLTDLDDVRVDKDPTQSGQIPKVGGTLPPSNRPITMPPMGTLPPSNRPITQPPTGLALAAGTNLVRNTQRVAADAQPTRQMTIEMMQVGLEHATSREAATDLVLAYVATRWLTGLVLAVRDKAAIGYRGHGVHAPELVTISLGSPSTVQRAVQSRFVTVEAPSGVGQSALTHALQGSTAPAAAPVMVKGQAVAVIAVGDPISGAEYRDACAVDLAMLAEALGAAYTRILAR